MPMSAIIINMPLLSNKLLLSKLSSSPLSPWVLVLLLLLSRLRLRLGSCGVRSRHDDGEDEAVGDADTRFDTDGARPMLVLSSSVATRFVAGVAMAMTGFGFDAVVVLTSCW